MDDQRAACATNIGPRQVRHRLYLGLFWIAVGLAGSGVLWYLDPSPWWRLTLFLPYWIGLIAILQAGTRT